MRPLEEVGGALERTFATEFRTWRLRRVERYEGWFRLERKRMFRPDISCQLRLVSAGNGRTAIEVEATAEPLACKLAAELHKLAWQALQTPTGTNRGTSTL